MKKLYLCFSFIRIVCITYLSYFLMYVFVYAVFDVNVCMLKQLLYVLCAYCMYVCM